MCLSSSVFLVARDRKLKSLMDLLELFLTYYLKISKGNELQVWFN